MSVPNCFNTNHAARTASDARHMDNVFRIPAHLQDVALETFDISIRSINRLAQEGIVRLADLHGISVEDLLELRVSGPLGVQEIYTAVNEFLRERVTPQEIITDPPQQPEATAMVPTNVSPVTDAVVPSAAPALPTALASLPLEAICSPRLLPRLTDADYRTLSDLVRASIEEVISVTGAGEAVVGRLFRKVEQILDGEVDPLLARANDPVHDFLDLLAAAGCTDIEREAVILERLHGLWGRPEETLEAIGADLGVSRERTRQLRTRAEDRVRKALGWYEPEVLRQARRALARQGGLILLEELARETERAFAKESVDLEGYLKWLIRAAEHPSIRLVGDTLVIGPPVGFDRFRRVHDRIRSLLQVEQPVALEEIVQQTEDLWEPVEPVTVSSHCSLIARTLSYEVIPGLFSAQRWARAEWAEYVLQQEGAPLHFMEIATRANRLAGTDYHEAGFNSVLNEDDRFVRVGAGDFGLSAWGIEPYGRFDEVIERYLRDRECPEHEDTIKDDLLAVYTVAPTTVTAMLSTNPDRFVHLGGGFWGLAGVVYTPDPAIEGEVVAILHRVGEPLTLDEIRRRLVIQMGRHDLITSQSLRRALYISPLIRRYGTTLPERFTFVSE